MFKVAPVNSTADDGPAAAAARPRRRGDRMSQREFVTLLGVALA